MSPGQHARRSACCNNLVGFFISLFPAVDREVRTIHAAQIATAAFVEGYDVWWMIPFRIIRGGQCQNLRGAELTQKPQPLQCSTLIATRPLAISASSPISGKYSKPVAKSFCDSDSETAPQRGRKKVGGLACASRKKKAFFHQARSGPGFLAVAAPLSESQPSPSGFIGTVTPLFSGAMGRAE